MENGSNKSKFEGMFMGANLKGAQIIVANESGGTVVYHQHAAPKGKRIHFPLGKRLHDDVLRRPN